MKKLEACTARTKQTVIHHKPYHPPTSREIDRYCELVHGHSDDHVFYYEGQERTFPQDPDEMRR